MPPPPIESVKVLDFELLEATIRELQAEGASVALCHGVFDLLHVGHLRYLKGAARLADRVVVTLTPDRHVDKGPYRPAFDEQLRLEALAALEAVDFVALNLWPTAEETLRRLRPDVYVKGAEFRERGADPTGKMELERRVAAEVGTRVEFIDDLVFSSSQLINRHVPVYPPEVSGYLERVRRRSSHPEAAALLDRLRDLRVLVVGDAIVDEYVYVDTLGKASKDPALAVRQLSEERFAGGAVAVANHVAAFGCRVDFLGPVGEDPRADFLRSSFAEAARGHLIERRGPTVTKRRFVDAYSSNKLLSVYEMDPAPPDRELVRSMSERLRELASGVDLVICADYGHGAIPQELLEPLCALPAFLAVNTQANAGNRGFHTVTRYGRADLVCLAEHEIRLETRDSEGELRPMMSRLAARLGSRLLIVTRGKRGSLALDSEGRFHEAPALASRVVDRIGAGDAFFSLAALAAQAGARPELVSLLGNAAGAQGVEIVGNRHALDAGALRKRLKAMLQ
ncbi:MAG: PfkB family carbohydrate kinase [Acidobacteriota bacterium]